MNTLKKKKERKKKPLIFFIFTFFSFSSFLLLCSFFLRTRNQSQQPFSVFSFLLIQNTHKHNMQVCILLCVCFLLYSLICFVLLLLVFFFCFFMIQFIIISFVQLCFVLYYFRTWTTTTPERGRTMKLKKTNSKMKKQSSRR